MTACFLLFAAGSEKYASYSANVGVHGASDQSGREEGDATVSMARMAKQLGVPESIIGKMVVTPPDQLHFFEDGTFLVGGRVDGAVQIAGANVFPSVIADRLRAHHAVAAASVRTMRPEEGESAFGKLHVEYVVVLPDMMEKGTRAQMVREEDLTVASLDTSHWINEEQPDKFNEILDAWLQKLSV